MGQAPLPARIVQRRRRRNRARHSTGIAVRVDDALAYRNIAPRGRDAATYAQRGFT
jgi:hypothetical protein